MFYKAGYVDLVHFKAFKFTKGRGCGYSWHRVISAIFVPFRMRFESSNRYISSKISNFVSGEFFYISFPSIDIDTDFSLRAECLFASMGHVGLIIFVNCEFNMFHVTNIGSRECFHHHAAF